MELTTIENLFNEISYLKKKSSLLDEILKYYDKETMTFDIPEKWKSTRNISPEKLKTIPKSPRHAIAKKIIENIPFSECEHLVDWNAANEKYK